MLYVDEGWEGGTSGDNDMSIISISISTVEVALETLLGWLNE